MPHEDFTYKDSKLLLDYELSQQLATMLSHASATASIMQYKFIPWSDEGRDMYAALHTLGIHCLAENRKVDITICVNNRVGAAATFAKPHTYDMEWLAQLNELYAPYLNIRVKKINSSRRDALHSKAVAVDNRVLLKSGEGSTDNGNTRDSKHESGLCLVSQGAAESVHHIAGDLVDDERAKDVGSPTPKPSSMPIRLAASPPTLDTVTLAALQLKNASTEEEKKEEAPTSLEDTFAQLLLRRETHLKHLTHMDRKEADSYTEAGKAIAQQLASDIAALREAHADEQEKMDAILARQLQRFQPALVAHYNACLLGFYSGHSEQVSRIDFKRHQLLAEALDVKPDDVHHFFSIEASDDEPSVTTIENQRRNYQQAERALQTLIERYKDDLEETKITATQALLIHWEFQQAIEAMHLALQHINQLDTDAIKELVDPFEEELYNELLLVDDDHPLKNSADALIHLYDHVIATKEATASKVDKPMKLFHKTAHADLKKPDTDSPYKKDAIAHIDALPHGSCIRISMSNINDHDFIDALSHACNRGIVVKIFIGKYTNHTRQSREPASNTTNIDCINLLLEKIEEPMQGNLQVR